MITHPLTSARWRFRETSRREWLPAIVPGCVHRDLLRAGRIPDPFWGRNELDLQWIEERDWEYRTEFTLAAALRHEEVVELVADGLDTVAIVCLNGHEIGRSDNMFVGHRWNVTARLRRGRNELRIVFRSAMDYIRTQRTEHQPREINDPVGRCTVIRKEQCQFGWDWAPRLVTAGIWRDIRLEAWTGNRIEALRVVQHHAAPDLVRLEFAPTLARPESGGRLEGEVLLDGKLVARIEHGAARIANPRLWWPNGQGAQPLYEVRCVLRAADNRVLDRWERRIGLRTVELRRAPDQWGESFAFVVNGRAIFAKGANWVPAHSFVAGLDRATYARDLRAAAAAHMNMLRVWGGGIYEHDDFYDLCDELGLLVWQDFMFSCTLYPADVSFLASVRREAEYQVRRLRHHACLALWCGNNEVAQLNGTKLAEPAARTDYEKLFAQLLPEVVAADDGVAAYWPTSEWRGGFACAVDEGERRGDSHFWDVWHMRKPVKSYEAHAFRFVSEFGMQSFPSPAALAAFCPVGDTNLLGPSVENHQKNRGGTQTIFDYVTSRYRLPKDQDSLIYLSQLNQAYCMQVGVEHYRRLMPRCMGALYWQLNDCWPGVSWSSIEHGGQWKALHYAARQFFSPCAASAHVPGDESFTIGNYRRSSVREAHLYTVSDATARRKGELRWRLLHFDGAQLLQGRKSVVLRPGQSACQKTLDLAKMFARHGREQVFLRLTLVVGDAVVTDDAVFFASPRFLTLPVARTRVEFRPVSARQVVVTFHSDAFQHRFAFGFAGLPYHARENFFELFAGERRETLVDFERPVRIGELRRKLHYRSLVDTYSHTAAQAGASSP